MEISINKRSYNKVATMLKRLPQDWQRDEATMAIFRKASRPMLIAGASQLASDVPELSMANGIDFKSKKDRTGTIMRTGLVAKGKGRLGHLFNSGTDERTQYSTGKNVGRIDKSNFGNGWWDKAKARGMPLVEEQIGKVARTTISRYERKYR